MTNETVVIYEASMKETFGFSDDIFEGNDTHTRYIEKVKILNKVKKYKNFNRLKKDKKMFKFLVQKNLLSEIMSKLNWELPKRETQIAKDYVIYKIKQGEISTKRPLMTVSSRTVVSMYYFIQNHAHFNGICFDPQFARRIQAINKG